MRPNRPATTGGFLFLSHLQPPVHLKILLIISLFRLDNEFLIGYFLKIYVLIISHSIIQENKRS